MEMFVTKKYAAEEREGVDPLVKLRVEEEGKGAGGECKKCGGIVGDVENFDECRQS